MVKLMLPMTTGASGIAISRDKTVIGRDRPEREEDHCERDEPAWFRFSHSPSWRRLSRWSG